MGLTKGVMLMLAATLIFSLNNVLIKFLQHIPAVEIVTFRAGVTLVLAVAVLWRKKKSLLGTHRRMLVARGVFGSIALMSFVFTVQRMPLATATVIHYLSPVFTAIIAVVWLREKVRPIRWLFFAFSFLGVILIKSFDPDVSLFLLLLGVNSAVFAALAYSSIRHIKDKEEPMVIIFYFSILTIPTAGIFSAFVWVMPVGWEWAGLIGVGLLMHTFQWLITKAYQMEEANRIASVNYVGLLFAIAWGYLFFGELLSVWVLLGMGLIVGGVLLNIYTKTNKAV